ncbi:MAG TPA: hypothetical protein VHB02_11390 [Acidimicrobiales bacterium]|nr:hypothetical protein [Acidimicrobiales bacterium]
MASSSRWSRWAAVGVAVAGLGVGGAWAVPTAASAAAPSPKAKAQLLRLSDFPAGWKATPTTTSSTSTTSQFASIAACEGITGSTVQTTVPDAQAGFSRQKAAQFAMEIVGLWPSPGAAKKVYAIFSAPKAPTCIGDMLAKAVASTSTGNITASDITVAKFRAPRVGSASTGLRLTIPLTVQGSQVTMNADFVVIRKGKDIAIVMPFGLEGLMPAGFTTSLSKKAAARLH